MKSVTKDLSGFANSLRSEIIILRRNNIYGKSLKLWALGRSHALLEIIFCQFKAIGQDRDARFSAKPKIVC